MLDRPIYILSYFIQLYVVVIREFFLTYIFSDGNYNKPFDDELRPLQDFFQLKNFEEGLLSESKQ